MTRLEEQEKIDTAEIQIDIPDEDFVVLAKIAHERDITFNQLVNDILREKMNEYDDTFQTYRQELRREFNETVNYDLQSGVYEADVYSEYLERKIYEANIPIIKSIL